MDSLSFNLQAEKANAILKHRKLQRIASLFRLVEVCVVLVLISRLSLKLPVAVRNSSEYLRDLSLFMNSTRFVFLIGNVIIITLFAQCSGRNVPEPDHVYQQQEELLVVHNSTKQEEEEEKQRTRTDDGICGSSTVEGNSIEKKGIDAGKTKSSGEQKMKTGGANIIGMEVRKKGYSYRRWETGVFKKRRRVLRRCESENERKSIEAAPVVEEVAYPEDEMSSEEFRRTVEAFIARQQRVRREED